MTQHRNGVLKKQFVAIVILVTFVGAGIILYAQKRPPTKVTVAKIIRIPLCVELEALGSTLANESVRITANTSDKVKTIHFEDGQSVKAGDTLVELDKEEEESELKSLEALLIEKVPSFERAKVLVGKKATTRAELETREASLKELQGDIDVVKAKIKDRVIKAPFSGILGFREISVGTLVQPGDVITTLYDVSKIKVNFEVPSIFLSALQVGLDVTGIVDAYPDKEFAGKIVAVSPQVNPTTRTILVRALIPNEENLLKPGLLIKILVRTKKRNALVVPEESVKQRGVQHFVHLIQKGDGDAAFAVLKKVDIGVRKSGIVEVMNGLKAGDLVVERGNLSINGRHPVIISEPTIHLPTDLKEFKCREDK